MPVPQTSFLEPPLASSPLERADPAMIDVALAADLSMVRSSYRRVLGRNPRYRIVWEGDALPDEAWYELRSPRQVTLLDFRSPAHEHQGQLQAWTNERSKLLLVRSRQRVEALAEIFRSGVRGLVAREDPPHFIRLAIEALSEGASYVSSSFRSSGVSFSGLLAEDQELLRSLALGRTVYELARNQDRGFPEFKAHTLKLMQRVGCTTREQLLGLAIRQGLLPIAPN